MLPYRDSKLTKITLGIFFLVVLTYAYFEVRGLLYGPHIVITSNTFTVYEQYVVIKGRADRIVSLNIDGAHVEVTTDGIFEIPYLLADGLNHITLDARDNYGHTTSKSIEIVYVPTAPTIVATSSMYIATSTSSTTNSAI